MKRFSDQLNSGGGEKPVVSHHNGDFGMYFSQKIAKLQTLHTSSTVISDIFKNCVVYINGITNPPIEEIRRLVGLHGGQALAYRVSHVTHLVCEYFTDAQLKQELNRKNFHSSKSKIYYVTASWVVDSIRLKCRQAESLYTPPGMKGRFGANIATMFQKNNSVEVTDHSQNTNSTVICVASSPSIDTSTPRSSSSSVLLSDEVIELCDTPKTDTNLSAIAQDLQEFTLSQQQLLRSLPQNLRDDALWQLRQHNMQNKNRFVNAVIIDVASSNNSSQCLAGNESEENPKLDQAELSGKEGLQQLVDYVFSDRTYDFMGNYQLELLSTSARLAIRQRLAVSKCIEDGKCFTEELGELLYHYGVWLIYVRNDVVLVELLLKQLSKLVDDYELRHDLIMCVHKVQTVLQRLFRGKLTL
ncbi:hypothetical protein EON65_05850 [archaeon]|nr:MAG: hypothetical protein EON65_05850 [archaeon]